jgi:PAT family beta-lactamase induction signal transducer AmpG
MAVLMAIGVSASLMATEPLRAKKALRGGSGDAVMDAARVFRRRDRPVQGILRVYGWLALLMLAMISFYQLPEYMTGPMYNPLYHDIGLSKDVVGAVRASIGLVATLVGITAGGFCALRFGYMRTLIAGVILKMLVIANFATLAHAGPSVPVFGAVIAADNFGIGFAGRRARSPTCRA